MKKKSFYPPFVSRVSAFPFRAIQRRERIVARRVVLEQKKGKGTVEPWRSKRGIERKLCAFKRVVVPTLETLNENYTRRVISRELFRFSYRKREKGGGKERGKGEREEEIRHFLARRRHARVN